MPSSALPEPTLVLTLPARADPLADPALFGFLRENHDCAVEVDMTELRQLTGPLVEMLLVTSADRRARNVPFAITGLSAAHSAQLDLVGLSAHLPIRAPDSAGPQL